MSRQRGFKHANIHLPPSAAVATYAPWETENVVRAANEEGVEKMKITSHLRMDLSSYMRESKRADAGKRSLTEHDLLLFSPRQQHLLQAGKRAAAGHHGGRTGYKALMTPVRPRGISSQVLF